MAGDARPDRIERMLQLLISLRCRDGFKHDWHSDWDQADICNRCQFAADEYARSAEELVGLLVELIGADNLPYLAPLK